MPSSSCRVWIPRTAFTMVELLAAIAIIALLVAVIVPAIGNYVETARKTADKQTLMVLNDALTRYKTMGGDMTALTSGASIGNVLTKLQTAVTWCGMRHQFLRTGETYNSSDLGAIGEGQRYRFTKYGSFADGSVIGSDILETYADAGYDVGDEAAFDEWITQAMAETGTTNYLALTNPNTTDRFGIYARVANGSDKVRVWWGDGTTEDFDSMSTSSSSAIAKVFASAAKRTVVIVGDLSQIGSNNEASIGGTGATYFGGDISTMPSLTLISVIGSNTLSGSIANLNELTFLNVQGINTLTGDISKLKTLTYLLVHGQNTLSGDVSGLINLTYLSSGGNNSFSGDVSNLSLLTGLNVQGTNTLTGDVSSLPLQYINLSGNSTIDVASLVTVSGTATGLSCFAINDNYTLNQTQVDSILSNIWANRDSVKPRSSERYIDIDQTNHATPSAAGLTTKANLQAYMSPNNTGPSVWTVNTN